MRPSKDLTWLRVAREISRQSTCLRRSVGCVLLDARGRVLSTGWNGVGSGEPHCNQELNEPVLIPDEHGFSVQVTYPFACPGANAPSGTMLDACGALHAEWNALMQCPDVQRIHTCYCTTSPCVTCVKLLKATSCQRIVFIEPYVQPEAERLWLASGSHKSWEEVSVFHVAACEVPQG